MSRTRGRTLDRIIDGKLARFHSRKSAALRSAGASSILCCTSTAPVSATSKATGSAPAP